MTIDDDDHPTDPALAARLEPLGSPATTLLGTRLLALDEAAGVARFSFVGRRDFTNMLGNIQGGFVAAMLDETAGLTARLLEGPDLAVPTLDFSVRFLRPVPAGRVLSVGRVVRAGRRICFLEADLVALDGSLLSRISATALAVRAANA